VHQKSAVDRVFPLPHVTLRMLGDRALYVNGVTGASRPLDAITAYALAACRGVRTLDEHSALVSRALHIAQADALAITKRLYSGGLLAASSSLTVGPGGRGGPRSRPQTVVVITADRPTLLARCLRALVSNCRYGAARPALMVIDGSRSRANAKAGRWALSSVPRGTFSSCRYIGGHERRRLCSAISRRATSIDPSLLRFALAGGWTGANRNVAQLLTQGESYVSVDDDVICRLWGSGSDETIRVVGHDDVRRSDYFATRAQATDGLNVLPLSVCDAHGLLLGRRLVDVVADGSAVDLSEACPHALRALLRRSGAMVRVTCAGLAGDSAAWVYGRLLSAGVGIHATSADADALRVAMASRETRRVAAYPSICHEARCMGYCMGVDNSDLMPPFIPRGRNQDGLFGLLMTAIDEEAFVGHLASGVIHDSDRGAAYTTEEVRRAAITRVSDVVGGLVKAFAAHIGPGDPAARLVRLGERVRSVAQLDRREFVAYIKMVAGVTVASYVSGAMSRVGPGGASEWLRREVATYADSWQRDFCGAPNGAPVELRGTKGESGWDATRTFLLQYGELLVRWGDVCAACGPDLAGSVALPS
jgi:hypothetical protein